MIISGRLQKWFFSEKCSKAGSEMRATMQYLTMKWRRCQLQSHLDIKYNLIFPLIFFLTVKKNSWEI